MGARFYAPIIGRWNVVGLLAEKNHFDSGYAYVRNNPINAVDPDVGYGILMAFPDYKISTLVGKVGRLGHAGVLLIDNKTGLTKYYEYERYDSKGKSLVRTVSVSNVVIGKDGKPTAVSIQKVLAQISKKSGQGTRIDGAYSIKQKKLQMNNYKKSDIIFFSELIKRFPELKDDLLDEDFEGIISLQMGVFTRFTQGAISKGNYNRLKKCYEFIENNFGNVSSELENSIVISYLGKLKFGESPKAKQLLPAMLRKIIDDLDSYNISASKNDKLNQFLKDL